MAGIGFQLRRLARQDTISAVIASAGHAAVIAAGPWLFTILSLAGITFLSERVAGADNLATFRAIIIYAFALSLVLTAPVTIVATRLVADALWAKQPETVRTLLFGAFAVALLAVAVGLVALLAFFQLPAPLAVPLASASLLVGLIWVALCFCGAVRDYSAVTWSFLSGLIVSLLASVGAALAGWGAPGMAMGFILGLAITFFGMTACVLRTFPMAVERPLAGLKAIAAGFGTYLPFAVGALAGTAGVWIDKWIFWASPIGERVQGGLVHAPLYDSAMFIASLVIIPALSAFVVKLETEFFDRYQQYYATIQSHGTLGQIEEARARLARYTLDNLTLTTVMQVGICAVMILAAPLLVEALGLRFSQISILRYGSLGAVFQFIFIACTSMLLFFDRRYLYLWHQVLFLVLNTGFTLATIALGEDFYGVGYFLAAFLVAASAFFFANATFERLNFLTFLGNNPSVRASVSLRRRATAERRPLRDHR